MSDAATVDRPLFDRRAIPVEARETQWLAADGHALRRIDWPGVDAAGNGGRERGSILFLPGRGDAYEKYLETLDHWHRAGWRVTAADWRGQAGSGRLGRDAVTGHIGDFSAWIDDLAHLWRIWCADTPGPHVLAAHSMGAHLALRAVAERRVEPAALVLSAPMLGLRPAWLPPAVFQALATIQNWIGDEARPAWKWNEKPGVPPDDRIDLLTRDRNRYEDELWWRAHRSELVMGPPSWRWMERAIASMRLLARPGMLEGIRCPVLLLAAPSDRLVEIGAIRRAAARLPHGELVEFGPEARHELLREADDARDAALAAIDRFLDAHASRTTQGEAA